MKDSIEIYRFLGKKVMIDKTLKDVYIMTIIDVDKNELIGLQDYIEYLESKFVEVQHAKSKKETSVD